MTTYDDYNVNLLDLNEIINEELPPGLLIDNTIELESLKKCPQNVQIAAICQWFFRNYCDPNENLPFNSQEGGFIWIHGGPYQADEVIEDTFTDYASDQAIKESITLIQGEGILDWSGRPIDDDFYCNLNVHSLNDAFGNLFNSIAIVKQEIEKSNQPIYNILFASLISALETFVWQTAYILSADVNIAKLIIDFYQKEVLPKQIHLYINANKLFQHKDLVISDFLTQVARELLASTTWHNVNRVNKLLQCLSINVDINNFKEAIDKRHIIVHKSGIKSDTSSIIIEKKELLDLITKLETFANQVRTETQ